MHFYFKTLNGITESLFIQGSLFLHIIISMYGACLHMKCYAVKNDNPF